MASAEQLLALVEQMPEADNRGMYTDKIDREKIEKAAAEIAQGGAENIVGLVKMLGDPGSADDVKPHYALHCAVNHALVAKNEALRREICEALASQLDNAELDQQNRAYLCQELQWAGRDEACAALGKALLDDEVTDAAATALAAIGSEQAAAELGAAAAKATGKARLNIVDALASMAAPTSAAIFERALADDDREVRIAAALGWANIGSPAAVDPLFEAADRAAGWERTQATKACLVLAEKLAAAGDKAAAKGVYERLQKSRSGDAEAHFREAARRGLAAIA